MTLEKAIQYYTKKVESMPCGKCQDEYIQLLKWLIELKESRNELKELGKWCNDLFKLIFPDLEDNIKSNLFNE